MQGHLNKGIKRVSNKNSEMLLILEKIRKRCMNIKSITLCARVSSFMETVNSQSLWGASQVGNTLSGTTSSVIQTFAQAKDEKLHVTSLSNIFLWTGV